MRPRIEGRRVVIKPQSRAAAVLPKNALQYG
jgi:hypothetical protein